MVLAKLYDIPIYRKTLVTWLVQPRGTVILFILTMWYVCIRFKNIFSRFGKKLKMKICQERKRDSKGW